MLNPIQKIADKALKVFYRWTDSWPWPFKLFALLLIVASAWAGVIVAVSAIPVLLVSVLM